MQRINWFPGHMAKARREIGKAMPTTHVIFEVLDARLPFSSSNPLVTRLRRDTPCIKILNKSDLADPDVTDAWLEHFNAQPNTLAVALDGRQTGRVKELLDRMRPLLDPERNKTKPVRVMIVGVPNVGKSTLINTLAGRTLAKASNKPAVTRRQQVVPCPGNVLLVDTPGFLWPRLDPVECGYRLAVSGAIADNVVHYEHLGEFTARFLIARYPELTKARYKLDTLPDEPIPLLHAIAPKRGCLRKGGVIDLQKVSEVVVRDVRQGNLGRISLERPEDVRQD